MEHRINSQKTSSLIYYIVVSLCYILLLYLCGRHIIDVETLWYDEAGQFYIAKGLNHYSDPNSPYGDVFDVIYNNARFNQDPGGFGIILHYWSMISNSHIWLRLLPFMFFVGCIVFFCLVTKQITKNNKLAYVSGLFVFALIGGSQAFLLRAYSMELFGSVAGIWLILWLYNKLSLKRLVIAGFLLAVLITSRYNMVVVGFINSCFVIGFILASKKSLWSKCYSIILYSLPLVCTVICIYAFAMSIQNPEGKSLAYIEYLDLRYWIAYIPLCLLPVLLATWKRQSNESKIVIAATAFTFSLFIALGMAGKLPWTIVGQQGGMLLVLFYLCSFNSFAIVFQRRIRCYPIVTFVFVGVYIVYLNLGWGSTSISNPWWNDTTNPIRWICNQDVEKVYVASYSNPEVRYLMEEGALRDSASDIGYPDKFEFFKGDNHCTINESESSIANYVDSLKSLPHGSLLLDAYSSPDGNLFPTKFKFPSCFKEICPGIFLKMD